MGAAEDAAEQRRQSLRAEEARKLAQLEEQKNQEEVDAFCQDNGFVNANTKRKRRFKWKYALHSAVKKQDAEMVQRLLRARADPTLPNSSGLTPYQLAEKMSASGTDVSSVLLAFPTK